MVPNKATVPGSAGHGSFEIKLGPFALAILLLALAGSISTLALHFTDIFGALSFSK